MQSAGHKFFDPWFSYWKNRHDSAKQNHFKLSWPYMAGWLSLFHVCLQVCDIMNIQPTLDCTGSLYKTIIEGVVQNLLEFGNPDIFPV